MTEKTAYAITTEATRWDITTEVGYAGTVILLPGGAYLAIGGWGWENTYPTLQEAADKLADATRWAMA